HWIAGFRFRHLLNSIRYPSLVVAIGGALALDIGLDLNVTAPRWFGFPGRFWALAAYALVLATAGILRLVAVPKRARKHHPSRKREVVSLDKMPIERILEWAEKEEVIDSPTADLFGVDFRAKRVAQYLIGAKQKAVAVV